MEEGEDGVVEVEEEEEGEGISTHVVVCAYFGLVHSLPIFL